MKRRLTALASVLLVTGCRIAEIDWGEWLADASTVAVTEGLKQAAGDNAGPLFTGEKRGEYRDRKEVERVGLNRFRQRYGREPDLYLPPGSTDW